MTKTLKYYLLSVNERIVRIADTVEELQEFFETEYPSSLGKPVWYTNSDSSDGCLFACSAQFIEAQIYVGTYHAQIDPSEVVIYDKEGL